MDRPSNLYELMDQVVEHMEARPLNYYQGNWACPVEAEGYHPRTIKPLTIREVPLEVTFTHKCPKCHLLFNKDMKLIEDIE